MKDNDTHIQDSERGGEAHADARMPKMHYGEVLRIIEGATRGDMKKVKAYADLLADKLDEDGEHSTAERIRKVASGNAGAIIRPLASDEKPIAPKSSCSVCKGAGFMQNDATKEVRACWECNVGGKLDKSLTRARWA